MRGWSLELRQYKHVIVACLFYNGKQKMACMNDPDWCEGICAAYNMKLVAVHIEWERLSTLPIGEGIYLYENVKDVEGNHELH